MTLALLWTSRGAGVGVVSSMGGGADEGPAIGAGPVVSVVASASADVAAVAVVSASVSVATTSVVYCITANTLMRPSGEVDYCVTVGSTLIWDEVEDEDVIPQNRLSYVNSALPVVQLEIQSGGVGFEVNPPRHELADAE
ncbi:unnamed protein product [Closterium sp. NIES-53]